MARVVRIRPFRGPTVSGLGVAFVVAGTVLIGSALFNVTVGDLLRSWIRGQFVPPTGDTKVLRKIEGPRSTATTGGRIGEAVAATAREYASRGVPYVWGGESPSGWDCSGFVTYVLAHDHGIALPNNHHTVAAQFYVWTGAFSIPRANCSPGDLVCWPSHVAIAVSNTHMVHAPGVGKPTQESRIWSVPAPVIRRPKAYG